MYELALHFRIWDVPGWLAQISWRQLQLWFQFREVQPFGEEREDLRSGQIAAMLLNVNRADRKAKVYSASDLVRMLEPAVLPETDKRKSGGADGPVDHATEEARWQEYKAATKALVRAGRVPKRSADKPAPTPTPARPRLRRPAAAEVIS